MVWTCLNCLREFDIDPKDVIVEEYKDVTVKGVPFAGIIHHAKCPICGEELCNDKILDNDLQTAYDKYCIIPGGGQRLSAMHIASQVICKYHDLGYGITNLKLQKVLFYIQMESLQKYNEPAFTDELEAWRHGAVCYKVYDYFKKYIVHDIKVSDPMVQKLYFPINKQLDEVINDVVKNTLEYEPWKMVELSQQKVWKDVYIPDSNNLITKHNLQKDGIMNIYNMDSIQSYYYNNSKDVNSNAVDVSDFLRIALSLNPEKCNSSRLSLEQIYHKVFPYDPIQDWSQKKCKNIEEKYNKTR